MVCGVSMSGYKILKRANFKSSTLVPVLSKSTVMRSSDCVVSTSVMVPVPKRLCSILMPVFSPLAFCLSVLSAGAEAADTLTVPAGALRGDSCALQGDDTGLWYDDRYDSNDGL